MVLGTSSLGRPKSLHVPGIISVSMHSQQTGHKLNETWLAASEQIWHRGLRKPLSISPDQSSPGRQCQGSEGSGTLKAAAQKALGQNYLVVVMGFENLFSKVNVSSCKDRDFFSNKMTSFDNSMVHIRLTRKNYVGLTGLWNNFLWVTSLSPFLFFSMAAAFWSCF